MKSLCKVCGKLVSSKNMGRHVQSHGDQNFSCDICNKSFSTRDYLNQHTRTHWQPEEIKCSLCSSSFFSRSALRKQHIYSCNTYLLLFHSTRDLVIYQVLMVHKKRAKKILCVPRLIGGTLLTK